MEKEHGIISFSQVVVVSLVVVAAIIVYMMQKGSSFFSFGDIPITKPFSGKVVAVDYYGNGVHTIVGAVEVTNACSEASVEARVAESSPEQIFLDITLREANDSCASAASSASASSISFSVDAHAGKDAVISARVNGAPANMQILGPMRERDEKDTVDAVSSPITLGVGDTKKIADITLSFTGVVSDSRCPEGASIACIWAGEVKASFTANGTSFDLIYPGGKSSKVVAGHTITLTDVNPHPMEGNVIEQSSYRATLTAVPVK